MHTLLLVLLSGGSAVLTGGWLSTKADGEDAFIPKLFNIDAWAVMAGIGAGSLLLGPFAAAVGVGAAIGATTVHVMRARRESEHKMKLEAEEARMLADNEAFQRAQDLRIQQAEAMRLEREDQLAHQQRPRRGRRPTGLLYTLFQSRPRPSGPAMGT